MNVVNSQEQNSPNYLGIDQSLIYEKAVADAARFTLMLSESEISHMFRVTNQIHVASAFYKFLRDHDISSGQITGFISRSIGKCLAFKLEDSIAESREVSLIAVYLYKVNLKKHSITVNIDTKNISTKVEIREL